MQQPNQQIAGPESGAAPILPAGNLCPHLNERGRRLVSQTPLRYLGWSPDGRLSAVYIVSADWIHEKLYSALVTYTAWSAGLDRRGVRVMMEVT